MQLIQIIVLALIQGLTEFLPVSSSAHLILGGQLLGWTDQGLAFDVATHLGTLLAVLIYFRTDLQRMLAANFKPAEADPAYRRLGRMLVVASIPTLIVGFAVAGLVEAWLRDIQVIAVTTLVFALLLYVADRVGSRIYTLQSLRWRQAMWIGLAQILALVPGTSRAGITITAGRALGLGRDAAARFSFLLSIPVIGAAGSYGAIQVLMGESVISALEFALAMGFSALTALFCIPVFLYLLKAVGLLPFIIYRLLLGLVLLWLAF
jgi:undecaprenyl-diphosphatase